MKYWDITRELLTAPVYPGDPPAALRPVSQTALGDAFTVSALACGTHSGTHLDAPLHCFPNGADVASLPLETVMGECTVLTYNGLLLGDEAEALLRRVTTPRLLFRGQTELSPSAAFVLSDAELCLVGVEAPSVTSGTDSAAVHRQLLGNGVTLLESLDLSKVPDGRYFLFAAPLKIAGADGAPVRAVLVERTR